MEAILKNRLDALPTLVLKYMNIFPYIHGLQDIGVHGPYFATTLMYDRHA